MKKTAVLLLCLSGYGLFAQKLNHFSLMNVTDGKTVSLENYSSAKGLIIIFTSNRCPYDEYYRNRIANLASSYSNSFPLILVNAHTEPEESNESMAKKHGNGTSIFLTWPIRIRHSFEPSMPAKAPKRFC